MLKICALFWVEIKFQLLWGQNTSRESVVRSIHFLKTASYLFNAWISLGKRVGKNVSGTWASGNGDLVLRSRKTSFRSVALTLAPPQGTKPVLTDCHVCNIVYLVCFSALTFIS
jgi:hypothetical protein